MAFILVQNKFHFVFENDIILNYSPKLLGDTRCDFCGFGSQNKTQIQGMTLTFAATCPVGQVRFNFHLPYSNFHLPLKNCMFDNISFKTK